MGIKEARKDMESGVPFEPDHSKGSWGGKDARASFGSSDHYSSSSGRPRYHDGPAAPSEGELRAFFSRNSIDERAAGDLRSCPAEVQALVLSRGDIPKDARNPSAMLLSRIKESRKDVEASQQVQGGWGRDDGGRSARDQDRAAWSGQERYSAFSHRDDRGEMALKADIERFVSTNGIDESAANDLRNSSPEVQARVLARGDLRDARNVSAMLLSRIRDARNSVGRPGPATRESYGQARGRDGKGTPASVTRGGRSRTPPRQPRAAGTYSASTGSARPSHPSSSTRASYGQRATPAGETRQTPLVYYLQLPDDSNFVMDGMPVQGPAIVQEKQLSIYRSADEMLQILLNDASSEVDIIDDTDCQQFPEVAAAFTQLGGDAISLTIAMCPSKGKWAAGFGGSPEAREAAARLALCLALEEDAERVNLAKTYPEFGELQAARAVSSGGEPFRPEDPVEPEAGASADGLVPITHSLELPEDAGLIQDGFRNEGVAIEHDASMAIFRSGHSILEALVGNMRFVKITDDPDWKNYPDVAEALGIAGAESSCYCVAISPERKQWGVGTGDDLKSRESAAKLALSLMLVGSSDKLEDLVQTYKDFGALVDASGIVVSPPTKRSRAA